MRKSLLVFCLCIAGHPAQSQFIGKLQFTPHGCEAAGKCELKYDFGYIDPRGIGWVSPAHDKTDGATIPFWAQPFIGAPFDKGFIRAAVIHDHYCDRHVRPESMTHMAFYNGLLEGGVRKWKAELMFYAVTVGATHWKDAIPGKKCKVGAQCIRAVGATPDLHGGAIMLSAAGEKQVIWKESYDVPGFDKDLQEVAALLEKADGAYTPQQIVELARARYPGNFALQGGDAILFEDAQSQYPKE